ncbi:C39 family peptidase [Virgibacillus senegalensis]|uniref:C39 family peptidase n=1 Tax=Virgibacillus senegalensis TaxID=1499679 RepID=UPI00069D3EAF|nr:C39 family peptidase [Virgibacillus senegalensis]
MLLFIFIFAILMTLMLTYFHHRNEKNSWRLFYKSYAMLFALCALTVSMMFLHHNRNAWLPTASVWLKEQANPVRALADELPSAELEPVFPLLEQFQLSDSKQLEAPLIQQYPELPRGCEVTSLAMLLQYNGIEVSKLELAKQIDKDATTYRRTESGIFFGNPSVGFVGDMYSLDKPGFGVYHEPVSKLAARYLGDRVHDFSGGHFYEILKHIHNEQPVWIITNSSFKKLPENDFQTWNTEQGSIKVTMKEHSVLVTGYDEKFIYFNDPLAKKQRKAPINDFKEAWVQMGKQAITVKP